MCDELCRDIQLPSVRQSPTLRFIVATSEIKRKQGTNAFASSSNNAHDILSVQINNKESDWTISSGHDFSLV